MDRKKRIEIADETTTILREKSYVARHPSTGASTLVNLSEVLDASCQGTKLYGIQAQLNLPDKEKPWATKIHMTNESTLQCLHRLQQEGFEDVMVLSFASAKKPGGGLNRGSWEQEEELAAATGLVSCLSTPQAKAFYALHKELSKPDKAKAGVFIYSSNMIYSPYVPVFRDPDMALTLEPYTCNVISACCVNYNTGMMSKSMSKADQESAILTMQARTLRVLQLAAHHGAETVILGAWGCGINKNPPWEVAKAFNGALLHPDMEGRFKQVIFAVPDEESSAVYRYFAKTFPIYSLSD